MSQAQNTGGGHQPRASMFMDI